MARAAPPAGARECAAQLLDTVPAVMDSLRLAMRRHVGDDLSVPQFRCLNRVSRHPGSSIGDIAAFLGVTMPTASVMVDRLVRAGVIETKAHASDRRRASLHLTRAGRAQLRQIRADAQHDFSQALGTCSPEQLATLSRGLDLLTRLVLDEPMAWRGEAAQKIPRTRTPETRP
jgi:DNA-binding MarR family transcriptional regulator